MNRFRLETVVRIAELGSFGKAARVLDPAQSALGRQVRQLETDLRAWLLQRTGRGAVLTEAARCLFEHGAGLLGLVARARAPASARRAVSAGPGVVHSGRWRSRPEG